MSKLKFFLFSLSFIFVAPFLGLASDETLTITTYYPSPYGVYNEMRSKRMAIGDDYINNADYAWELTDSDGGEIDYLADLVVEGNVGIGTVNPAEKMEVSGNIKLSGASATYKITNVANPTAAQDVATKAYVDAVAGGGPTCTVRDTTVQGTYYAWALCELGEVAINGGCDYQTCGASSQRGSIPYTQDGKQGWLCYAITTCYPFAKVNCCKY